MREIDEQIWHMYERDLTAARKSNATVTGYWYAVSDLSGSLPDGTDLLAACRDDIANWLAGLTGRVSGSTQATYLRRCRTFYTHMIVAEYAEVHPMLAIARIQEDRTIMRCPDAEDVARLVAVCGGKEPADRRDLAMVRILCEAGTPRAHELAGIRLDDLDLSHDRLTIRGKGGLERQIKLGAKCCRAITLWLRVRREERLAQEPGTRDLLFFSKYGKFSSSGLRSVIRERCEQAGIATILPHDMRRFTYDQWDELDGNAGAAMQLWGWQTPTMPALYGRQNAGRRALTHAGALSLGDRL